MNITPTTRTVTEYHLTLSAEDAALALDDPKAFGEQMAAQLRPHMAPPNGNGHKKPRKATTRPNGRNALGKVACPECGKKVAAKYLSFHTAKKHPALSASAA